MVNNEENQKRIAIGQKLKAWRKAANLSSDEAAKKIGITGSYIRSIEGNVFSSPINKPSRDVLYKLAELYKIDENELYRAYGYTEVKHETSEIPKTPQSIAIELNQMARSFIPIYKWPELEKPIDYASYGWQSAPHDHIKLYIIKNCVCEINIPIKDGDFILVDSSLKPKPESYCLYKNSEGNPLVTTKEPEKAEFIGVITNLGISI